MSELSVATIAESDWSAPTGAMKMAVSDKPIPAIDHGTIDRIVGTAGACCIVNTNAIIAARTWPAKLMSGFSTGNSQKKTALPDT